MLAVAQDVHVDRVARRELGERRVERMLLVDDLAVDARDDVAVLDAAEVGRLARLDARDGLTVWLEAADERPDVTGSFCSSASWRVIDTKWMPMYGRLSGSPATAWSMIGREMSIGIAKPMPLLFGAIAVLMPMTFPAASSSGPPELPGLIAASVWIRLVSCLAVVGRDRAALGRHDPARDRVRVRAQRAADGDDQLADLERIGLADRRGRQARGVDLDDREVGQRVDAVDAALAGRGRP